MACIYGMSETQISCLMAEANANLDALMSEHHQVSLDC